MANTSVQRREFVEAVQSTALAVSDLKADSRMQGVDVDAADLNHDGNISGTREAGALFDQVDRLDQDGSLNSLRTVHDGTATAVAPAVAAVGDLARAPGLQRKGRAAEPGNDDILFVGMRRETQGEAQALSARGAGRFNVTNIGSTDNSITVGSQTYDLSTNAGVRSFADSLGLPQAQADRVNDAILSNPTDGRAELGQLAVVLARGENGGTIPSRLVLSGHHAGGQFFGDRGHLSDRSLQDLARAMPRGAAQIEDLHLAGCYSYGRAQLDAWREAFPSLQTAWGYNHTAPAAGSGAETHEAQWEAATRGRVGVLNRSTARGTSVDSEVIVWSQQGGFQSANPPGTLADARARVSNDQAAFDSAFSGATRITDAHSGPVRDYYSNLNDLLDRSDLPANERPALEQKRDQAIRLLYYPDISKGFQSTQGATVAAGYTAAGRTAPDFSKLSRADANREINDFLTRTQGSADPAVLAARSRLTELRDLTPSAIPLNWIH
jgi:hypothetical protein